MIVYLDDALFPPSKDALSSARKAGAAQVLSQPWPAEYKGFKSGAHDLGEPEAVQPSMEHEPVTWGQLRKILANAADISEAAGTAAAIAKGDMNVASLSEVATADKP